jgi:peroxiredoxin
MPQEYDASKEWADKKVVLVSVPGAFTPGCQARHLPPYINNLDEIIKKGVDLVAVIAFNDAWVVRKLMCNGVTQPTWLPRGVSHGLGWPFVPYLLLS